MLDIIKQIALDAVDIQGFSDFCRGMVTETNPLTIRLEQGLVVTERFLLLTEGVTRREERGQIRTWTDTEGDKWSEYRMIRDKRLKAGEQVVLLKAAGGQQYLVLDRVGKEE